MAFWTVNVGKTPAFVTCSHINLWVGELDEVLPDQPEYLGPISNTSKFFVYPGGSIGPHKGGINEKMPSDEGARILKGEMKICPLGYIEFVDVFERKFRSGFAFRLKIGPDGKSTECYIEGPASYWYCTQQSD